MGTRCNIRIITPSGKQKTIYVSSDGYLDYTGKILLESWNTEKKVKQLADYGGRLSCMLEYPFVKNIRGEKADVRTDKHPIPDYDESLGEGYTYLWRNGKWYVTYFNGINADTDASIYRTLPLKDAVQNSKLKTYEGHKTKSPKKKCHKSSFPKLNVEGMF